MSMPTRGMKDDKKIIKIDDIYIITNGTPDHLATIKNPNQVGEVVDKDGVFLSDITPIIMIINKIISFNIIALCIYIFYPL